MTTNSTTTIWFGPSDVPGVGNPAGDEFMSVFNDPNAWQVTASQSVGFVLTEYFVDSATDQQLSQVLSFLKQHNLKLMMVAEMIPVQANGLGNGMEGFTAGTSLATAVQRISKLGGTLDWVGMDAVVAAGHEASTGPQLSLTALAQQIAPNVALIKALFPNVQFATDDGAVITSDVAAWSQAFQAATGSVMAAYDADVNWNAPISQLEAYAQAVHATGAAFNIMGDATATSTTDQSWALAAVTNIAAALADPLIRPNNIEVETEDANPTVTLPEGLSGTLAHVALEATEIAPLYNGGALVGGTGLVVSTVAPPPSYVGSAEDAVAGVAVSVPGVRLTASGTTAATATFAVVVTDVSGALGASSHGAGHVSGAGGNVLLLTGDLADINAELASLTYTGASPGTDTIDVTTYDSVGLVDDHQITVAIAAPLAISLPNGISAAALYANLFGTAASAAVLASMQLALAAGQTLANAAAPWIAQAQSTISLLCEQVQGGSPTSAALADLMTALANGASIATIRTALAGAAPVQSELAALYQSRYGSAPTAAQLTALTQQLVAGASLQAVEAPLLANSQAEAQITTLYQQVQGQAPDASDLVMGARALLTGTSLATLRAQLAAGAVAQSNLSALFNHVYDVLPTPAQLASLTASLATTTSYAQIQAQFTAVAQGMVTAAYQSVLNRAPTVSELGSFTTQLMAGSLEQCSIYAQLGWSAQSAANVTTMYQQVVGQAPTQPVIKALEQCLLVGSDPISLVQLRTDLATAASLYPQITGQPVTADAMTTLMYDFLCGETVSQMRFGYAHSAQENQTLNGLYQSLFGHAISQTQQVTLESALQAGTTTMAAVQSSLTAQAAADLPLVTDAVARQQGATNAWVAPFGALTVTDPDPGAIEQVTVSLTGGDGSLIGPAGNMNAAGTLYTRTGTASVVQGDLRAIDLVNPTKSGTANLLLTIQNGAGKTTSETVTISLQALQVPARTTLIFMPATSDTIAARGLETFVFTVGGSGAETISGFDLAQEIIQLPKSMAADFASLQRLESPVAGGTVIGFGSSESLILPGIAPNSLHASNFQFV